MVQSKGAQPVQGETYLTPLEEAFLRFERRLMLSAPKKRIKAPTTQGVWKKQAKVFPGKS